MENTDSSRLAISFMRFFATILITNAHLGPLYPPSLQLLSTGGALGNSLFFFSSGYALYLSNREKGFYYWITRRYTRIYPSLWIFIAFCSLLGISHYSLIDYIIPPYWFLQAILLFYILFFFTLKYFSHSLIYVCLFFLLPFLITYFATPHSDWIIENISDNYFLHWYFYYIIMLLGAITASKRLITGNVKLILLFLFIILAIYYGLKIQILHTQTPVYNLQLLLPIFLSLFSLYMFKFCSYFAKHTHQVKIIKVISFISELTLDIYIVQFIIMGYFSKFRFPTGFLLSIIGIISCAYILHLASEHLTKMLRRIFLYKKQTSLHR